MTSREESYKETKEFICTGCGKKIILTKFASQKTCKCDECKVNKIPTNPDIVAKALAENPPKKRHVASNTGKTKECKCINCGAIVTVSKFMSKDKVLCDDCKGTSSSKSKYTRDTAPRLFPDESKLDKKKLKPIEEYEVNDAIINNKNMRHVVCPSCGHQYIKPLMIVDGSQFGLIIDYQCPKCYTKVMVSEQARSMQKIYKQGRKFDYTGREIKDLALNFRDSSRLSNAVQLLIDICEKNNINIDNELDEFKDELPPYRSFNEMPVPKGFCIPPRDNWVHIIHTTIKYLEDGGDNDKEKIIDKLKELLKGEENGD